MGELGQVVLIPGWSYDIKPLFQQRGLAFRKKDEVSTPYVYKVLLNADTKGDHRWDLTEEAAGRGVVPGGAGSAPDNVEHGLRFVDRTIEADHISPDLTTLHLWARKLGNVKILRRLSDPGPTTKIPGQKAAIIFEFGAFIKDLWDNEPTSTGHGLCQRFARRAVIDWEGHEQTSDDDLVEAFKAVHSDASLANRGQDGEFKSRALGLVSRSRSYLRGVACIVTSNGCVGFAPYDTVDDDLVVVPRFPNPLVVLRKDTADPGQGGRHSYLMVGVANVDVDAVGVAESHSVDVAEYLVR